MREAIKQLERVTILFENKIRDNRKLILITFFLLIFISVLLLNLVQPLFTDDWEYSFIHRLYYCENKGFVSNIRIHSFSDILYSQYQHYFEWGGRSVNHIIAQLLLYIPVPFNKIVNSLAFTFLIFLICLFTKKKNEELKVSTPLVTLLLLFFTIPVIGSTILWLTGSANYLWGTFLLLLFLLPYKNYYDSEYQKIRTNYLKAIYLFLGGVIAGWTNENTVAIAICILLIFLFYMLKNKKLVPLWVCTGISGLIVGFCFMILAPGNFVRYEKALEEISIPNVSKIEILSNQFITASSGLFFYLYPIIFIYFLFFIVYRFYGYKEYKTTISSIVFFAASILSALIMTLSPSFPERAWFGIMCFGVIAIVTLYNKIIVKSKPFKIIKYYCILFFSIMMFGLYISGYKDLDRTNKIFEKRIRYINSQKEKGIMDIVFEKEIKSKSKINNVYDLTDDPNYWTNCFYARFYEINTVIVK